MRAVLAEGVGGGEKEASPFPHQRGADPTSLPRGLWEAEFRNIWSLPRRQLSLSALIPGPGFVSVCSTSVIFFFFNLLFVAVLLSWSNAQTVALILDKNLPPHPFCSLSVFSCL